MRLQKLPPPPSSSPRPAKLPGVHTPPDARARASSFRQVDTAFVGRLGLVPLAALGPNAALFNVVFFLCFTSLAVICVQSMAGAHSKGDAGTGGGDARPATAHGRPRTCRQLQHCAARRRSRPRPRPPASWLAADPAAARRRRAAVGTGRGFMTALTAAAGVGVVVTALLVSAPETVLSMFQTNAEMMADARVYCMIR